MQKQLKVIFVVQLTDYIEMHLSADFWLGRHLALVKSRVPGLHVFDLKRPDSRALHVERLESLIGDECHP